MVPCNIRFSLLGDNVMAGCQNHTHLPYLPWPLKWVWRGHQGRYGRKGSTVADCPGGITSRRFEIPPTSLSVKLTALQRKLHSTLNVGTCQLTGIVLIQTPVFSDSKEDKCLLWGRQTVIMLAWYCCGLTVTDCETSGLSHSLPHFGGRGESSQALTPGRSLSLIQPVSLDSGLLINKLSWFFTESGPHSVLFAREQMTTWIINHGKYFCELLEADNRC